MAFLAAVDIIDEYVTTDVKAELSNDYTCYFTNQQRR